VCRETLLVEQHQLGARPLRVAARSERDFAPVGQIEFDVPPIPRAVPWKDRDQAPVRSPRWTARRLDFAQSETTVHHVRIQKVDSSAMKARASSSSNTDPN
jgi:hypothetical protein